MDSKLANDPRLADLLLASDHLAAKVSDIPGASIVSDDVELDLSKYADEAEVVLAKFGSEVATVTVVGSIATLNFASAVTDSDVIELDLKRKL